jgi:hypothetical protein
MNSNVDTRDSGMVDYETILHQRDNLYHLLKRIINEADDVRGGQATIYIKESLLESAFDLVETIRKYKTVAKQHHEHLLP